MLVGLLLADLVALAVLNLESTALHEGIADAESDRYLSYQLADELRQSSDDLTTMVRLYAATGDPKHEVNFRRILAIRDGLAPRPDNYGRIYWDFVSAGVVPPGGPGTATSLAERMASAGFTPDEFTKLREAKANSDALVNLEDVAMHALKGEFDDGRGGFTRAGAPDAALALSLVFGQQYLTEKGRIMAPIDQFIGMIESRTAMTVGQLHSRAARLDRIATLLLIPGVTLAGLLLFMMRRWILQPLMTLEGTARQIGKGNLNVQVPVAREDEFGRVTRAFNEMAANLKSTTVSKNYIDGMLASMPNMVLVVDAVPGRPASEAIIRRATPAVHALLGWKPEELADQPLGGLLWEAAAAHAWIDAVHGGSEARGVEVSLRTKDGREVGVLFSAATLARGRQAAAQLVCVAQDLTERRRAEAAKLENERLVHDMSVARSIQQSLLPSSAPEVAGYSVAGWSQPADMAGGDYYDWITLTDGCLLVAIADVAGHGVGSAMLAAASRAYLRSCSESARGEALQQLAGRVNSLLSRDMPSDRFVTAAIAVLDPVRHELRVYSAGQAPIFYCRAADGEVESWDADDLPWGMVDLGNSDTGPRVLSFEPGDVLVFTTDGFFEWFGADGEAFGIARLSAAIRENRQLAPEKMIDALHRAVSEFARTDAQQDDLTAVVVKRDLAPVSTVAATIG